MKYLATWLPCVPFAFASCARPGCSLILDFCLLLVSYVHVTPCMTSCLDQRFLRSGFCSSALLCHLLLGPHLPCLSTLCPNEKPPLGLASSQSGTSLPQVALSTPIEAACPLSDDWLSSSLTPGWEASKERSREACREMKIPLFKNRKFIISGWRSPASLNIPS